MRLTAPRIAPLQDDVIDRSLGEPVAHGEPGLPGPDNDGRGVHQLICCSADVD